MGFVPEDAFLKPAHETDLYVNVALQIVGRLTLTFEIHPPWSGSYRRRDL
jgi:hypothetical protein